MRTILVVLMAALTGCASSVTRHPSGDGAKLDNPKVASVEIYLDDKAKALHPENLGFDPETLRRTVERALGASALLAADSPQRMAIEVTEMRMRSAVAAVMFGFLAGNDSVTGNVHVRSSDGRPVASFAVSASYALGGIAGGQDSTRMGWLYEEFAKLTVAGLTGKAADGVPVSGSDSARDVSAPGRAGLPAGASPDGKGSAESRAACHRTPNGLWLGC